MADPFSLWVGDFSYVETQNVGKALRLAVAWRLHSPEYGILGVKTSGNLILRNKYELVFKAQSPMRGNKRYAYASKGGVLWTLDFAKLIIDTVSQAPIGKKYKYTDFIGSKNEKPWTPPTTLTMKGNPILEDMYRDNKKGIWIDGSGKIRTGENDFLV